MTLGGVRLRGDRRYGWGLAYGTAPVERLWLVTIENYNALIEMLGKPQTLVMRGPRSERIYEQVYPLQLLPGPRYELRYLRVADRRWLWQYTWVSSSYNVPATTGDKFLLNTQGLLENAVPVPEARYKWASLNSGQPWLAQDMIQHVFNQVGQELRFGGGLDLVEPQNVVLDSRGDRAIAQALAHLPGQVVLLGPNGVAEIRNPNRERETDKFVRVQEAGRATTGTVLNKAVRPSKIVVLFTREMEVRFFYREEGSYSTDSNGLRNVASIPDIRVKIGDRILGRGSYEPISSLLEAWATVDAAFNPSPLVDQAGRALTNTLIRIWYMKHGPFAIQQRWGNNPALPPNPVNTARAQSVTSNWRQTFELDEKFRGRLESISPYRVGIINQFRHIRAPAEVHSDYVRRPSMLSFAKRGDPNGNLGVLVRGYNDLLDQCKVAPARVQMVDDDAGIFRIEYQTDPFGSFDLVAPGYPKTGEVPSAFLGSANRAQLDLFSNWDMIELEAGYTMSVILTVVPGTPNNTSRFYARTVEPGEINLGFAQGGGEGPPLYIHVPASLITARFAWLDAQQNAIMDSIKSDVAVQTPVDAAALDLCLTNKAELDAYAIAEATRVMEQFLDRVAGAAAIDLDPTVEPDGSLVSAENVVQSDGRAYTEVKFALPSPPPDAFHLLPAGVRQLVLRQLNDPRP